MKKNLILNQTKPFLLHNKPWLSLAAISITTIISMIVSSKIIFELIGMSNNTPIGNFSHSMTFHILTGFIIAPILLGLPKGKRKFNQYLQDIGIISNNSIIKLILLAISCYIFLALSQASSSFLYRFLEGKPITIEFIYEVFDLSSSFPPNSSSLLVSFPSMFEEVGFRGIALTVFLQKYSERKSIVCSSMGFGLMHLLNLTNGRELFWVFGQVIWAFSIGIFYGYVFVKTNSLVPSMIVHYLGNVWFVFREFLEIVRICDKISLAVDLHQHPEPASGMNITLD